MLQLRKPHVELVNAQPVQSLTCWAVNVCLLQVCTITHVLTIKLCLSVHALSSQIGGRIWPSLYTQSLQDGHAESR